MGTPHTVCVRTYTASREFHAHVQYQTRSPFNNSWCQFSVLSDRTVVDGEYNLYTCEGSSYLPTHTNVKMERDRLGQWGNGDNVIPSKTSGLERIRNPNLNKVRYIAHPIWGWSPICRWCDAHHVQCYELLTGSPLDNSICTWCDITNKHTCICLSYRIIHYLAAWRRASRRHSCHRQ